ncbi:MAG: SurA N-terminal domain-containing protein [Spirochaetota bacterium]|nr:MAG: SurA N-terminal domain-containing protein [Spirochaetota bacterium]
MKRYLLFFVLITVFSLIPVAYAEIVNGIACKVGYDIITIHEFNKAYELAKNQAAIFGIEKPLKKDVMNALVEDILIEREAERKGVIVTEDELDSIINNIKVQNKLSDEEFDRELEKEGINVEQLRHKYRIDILRSRLVNQMISVRGYLVEDEEIKKFYDDPKNRRMISVQGIVNLSEIFIEVSNDVTYKEAMEIKADATRIYESAIGGEDFKELVTEFSMSANKEQTGGYIGSFTKAQLLGMMTPDNVELLFSLDSGDITPPIRVKDGYRIFRIDKKIEEKVLTLEDAYESIRSYLLKLKGDDLFKTWIIELKEATNIEYMIDMG